MWFASIVGLVVVGCIWDIVPSSVPNENFAPIDNFEVLAPGARYDPLQLYRHYRVNIKQHLAQFAWKILNQQQKVLTIYQSNYCVVVTSLMKLVGPSG